MNSRKFGADHEFAVLQGQGMGVTNAALDAGLGDDYLAAGAKGGVQLAAGGVAEQRALLGDDRKAEQSFERALALAPNDSDVHHNWGWYLCQHKREREALAQFEIAVANSLYRTPEIALVNAGRCAQTIGEIRVAESYFRRALAAQPGNALASYGVALIAYKEARYDEARKWMRPVMQTTTPPPEAMYLGLCIERKLGDRQAELSYVTQLRNRFPDSVETKAITTEACE